jgi:hypothetical protein
LLAFLITQDSGPLCQREKHSLFAINGGGWSWHGDSLVCLCVCVGVGMGVYVWQTLWPSDEWGLQCMSMSRNLMAHWAIEFTTIPIGLTKLLHGPIDLYISRWFFVCALCIDVMMEAVRTSEVLVCFNKAAWCYPRKLSSDILPITLLNVHFLDN